MHGGAVEMEMEIDETIWRNYFEVGQTAYRSDCWPVAERMHRAALAEALRGVSADRQALSSYSLALVLLRQGRVAEAQKLLRKSVRLYSRLDSLNLTVVSSVLADTYWHEGAAEKAIPLLKFAMRLVLRRDGAASPHLLPVLKRMVLIYTEKKIYPQSDKYFRRLLEIQYRAGLMSFSRGASCDS